MISRSIGEICEFEQVGGSCVTKEVNIKIKTDRNLVYI